MNSRRLYVKMRVIKADNIKGEADLLQVMVGAVANTLQAYTLDKWRISGWTGNYD